MRLDQVIEFALANPELTENEMSLKEKYGGLTQREREAARLISQGKSNREIANEMTVGVKTAETYVTGSSTNSVSIRGCRLPHGW